MLLERLLWQPVRIVLRSVSLDAWILNGRNISGSSAPELGTVIIGVFFAKDDIGVSGVIGSAVFNIMFVIAVCALCSGTVCHLNWWPLVRDCFFYCLSIIVMLIIMLNDFISWVSKDYLCYIIHSHAVISEHLLRKTQPCAVNETIVQN